MHRKRGKGERECAFCLHLKLEVSQTEAARAAVLAPLPLRGEDGRGREQQTDKTTTISPSYWNFFKGRAQKIQIQKNEGGNGSGFVPSTARRRWGVGLELKVRIFLKKRSNFIHQGQVCKQERTIGSCKGVGFSFMDG
ncbi:hypothetical protein HY620_03280 [Candidatus Uhrbacteria bacterium]|nr:hypothetical protein [Candidatus Uhrbacteria bacterium]